MSYHSSCSLQVYKTPWKKAWGGRGRGKGGAGSDGDDEPPPPAPGGGQGSAYLTLQSGRGKSSDYHKG